MTQHEQELEFDDEKFAVELGATIHNLMWRQRLSARKLAPMVGLGQSTLSAKLRGDVKLSVTELMKIARVLDVDPGDLLPREEEVVRHQGLEPRTRCDGAFASDLHVSRSITCLMQPATVAEVVHLDAYRGRKAAS